MASFLYRGKNDMSKRPVWSFKQCGCRVFICYGRTKGGQKTNILDHYPLGLWYYFIIRIVLMLNILQGSWHIVITVSVTYLNFFSLACACLQVCGQWRDGRVFPIQDKSPVCVRGHWRSRRLFLWHACSGVRLWLPSTQSEVRMMR